MAKSASKTFESAFDAFSGNANETMKKSYERSVEMMGEFGELQKENMEAMAESTRIATKGVEELGTRAAAYSRGAFEKGVEAARTLTSAQSVQEAMELQANFTKSAFETYLEEVNAMTGMFASMVREAAAPLNAQAGKFVSTVQKTA